MLKCEFLEFIRIEMEKLLKNTPHEADGLRATENKAGTQAQSRFLILAFRAFLNLFPTTFSSCY